MAGSEEGLTLADRAESRSRKLTIDKELPKCLTKVKTKLAGKDKIKSDGRALNG
jgi:hypothetical protein